MSNSIDDLLEPGRVTRVEIKRRQVDLSEYPRAILMRLREATGAESGSSGGRADVREGWAAVDGGATIYFSIAKGQQ